MLGAPPWYGFPVGALVVCTTHTLDETSLRRTIPNVEPELHAAIQECARLLDPSEAVEDADLENVLKKRAKEAQHVSEKGSGNERIIS